MDSIDGIHIDDTFKEKGLTEQQVEESRKNHGMNKIEKKKKVPGIIRFLKQLADPMVILLMVAGLISLILCIIEGVGAIGHKIGGAELAVAIVEPIIIFGIVFGNAGFGMWQEGKANKEMEALQNLTSPHAKVIRDGELQIIDSTEIVVGDLLFLEAGDQISADATLLECFKLDVNESILTGESALVTKDVDEPDTSKREIEHKNKIFSGTSVINGSAKAIVTKIGSNTQMGQIAELIKKEDDNLTPFQKQLHKLSKYIGYFAIVIAIITFFVNIVLLSHGAFEIGKYWAESLKVSIALSIAAIPEGMLAIVMVVLATSVRRMSLKKALIKRLPSVETLGSTSIICSDKTGTLTQNKMTVVKLWNKDLKDITDDKVINQELLTYGTLCTNGTVNIDENNEIELVGDPTETSIIQALLDLGISKNDLTKQYKRLLEFPFDSQRKMMSVVVEEKTTGKKYVITKGAPDQIFAICTKSKSTIINKAKELNAQMSSNALRVLAISIRPIDVVPEDDDDLTILEQNQELIGLCGIIDPPREEVKVSIKECIRAGIRPIMITGDYKNTAVAISEQLGIMKEGSTAISGEELSALTDEQLIENIENYSVYARVSPQDKIRIVKAWQEKGKIVSMTGDGVNDAPSLKAADIGCAMGITGTDVSKQAADIILTDDNFSTIVEAVKEGRKVMNNIKNLLVLLLSTSFASLITIFIGMILFGGGYFSSLQILWVNIISETIPSLALGLNNSTEDLMRFKPRLKNANIIDKKNFARIFVIVFFISVLSLVAFYLGISTAMTNDFSGFGQIQGINFEEINTNAWNLTYIRDNLGTWVDKFPQLVRAGSALSFLTLTISLSSNALSLRSAETVFKQSLKDQQFVIYSFLGSYLTVAFVAYVPYVNFAFNMETFSYSANTIGYGAYSWINIYPYLAILFLLFVHEMMKLIIKKIDGTQPKATITTIITQAEKPKINTKN